MRKASEVTDPAEIERIWAARNIGRQPYAKIEEAFGLRPAGGMTALRVCGIHESRKKREGEWFSRHFAEQRKTSQAALSDEGRM